VTHDNAYAYHPKALSPMVEYYKVAECHLAMKMLAVTNYCKASIFVDMLT